MLNCVLLLPTGRSESLRTGLARTSIKELCSFARDAHEPQADKNFLSSCRSIAIPGTADHGTVVSSCHTDTNVCQCCLPPSVTEKESLQGADYRQAVPSSLARPIPVMNSSRERTLSPAGKKSRALLKLQQQSSLDYSICK